MQFEEVKELIAIFEKTDLNDMEVQLDNAVVRLNRGKAASMPPSAPAVPPVHLQANEGPEAVFMTGKIPAGGNEGDADKGDFITSPIVGTFYQSASPEKPPYVNVGDTVSKGDIVCIIEAMKFMNEVASEENGKIVEIFVEDGQFVEYGAPLFRLV